MPDETYKSHHDFLQKMDAGDLEGNFTVEMKKLSREQLEEVAKVLSERDDKRMKRENP